tara:strand:+ start:850 stop:2232 length:1383 start_codon:yes stop_codon:yes gene_type:complete
MALNREERKLLHHKSRKPTFGVNKPDPNEGKNGDISFRKIQGSGTVQYIKDNGNWLAIGSSGNLPPQRQIIYSSSSSSSGTSSSVTNHGDLLGLGDDNHTQYVHNTIARTITANHNFTGTPVFASPDINGGTIDAITSLTVANNVDIGSHDLRAATFTADGLTSGRVVFAGTDGVLSDDSDLTFSSDTLTATKIGAFTAAGAINFDNQDMTNVDIDSGAIDGTTIGANSQAAGDFTAIGAVAAGTIVGTTIDATTDFTIDGLVITPDTISNDADLTLDAGGDIILDAAGGQVFIQSAASTDAILQFKIGNSVRHMIGIDADDDDALRFHGAGPTQLATNCNMVLDASGIQLKGGNITFNDNQINIDNDTSGRLNIYNASLGLHINTPVPFNSGSGEMGHSDDTTTFDSFALRWKTLTGGTYNGQHIAGGEADYKNNYAMVGTFKESTRYADHSTSFVLQS